MENGNILNSAVLQAILDLQQSCVETDDLEMEELLDTVVNLLLQDEHLELLSLADRDFERHRYSDFS